MAVDKEKLTAVAQKLELIARQEAQKYRQSTGFKQLDAIISGLVDGSLIYIASHPRMGQTEFALDIATHLVKNSNKTVLFFPLKCHGNRSLSA